MQKIGSFWIPDVDASPGRNLKRSLSGFGDKEGVQIHHLYRALELVPGRAIAIDGGANVGAWSKVLAKEFDQVHSFEPSPDVFACLSRNLVDWGLDDKVVVHEKALSDRHEGIRIATKSSGRTVTGFVSGPGDIQSITIDSLGIPACSFIKLDVEGYECRALKGACRTIRHHQPWILIENEREKLPFWRRRTRAEDILEHYGYTLVEKIGDHELDWLFKPSR